MRGRHVEGKNKSMRDWNVGKAKKAKNRKEKAEKTLKREFGKYIEGKYWRMERRRKLLILEKRKKEDTRRYVKEMYWWMYLLRLVVDKVNKVSIYLSNYLSMKRGVERLTKSIHTSIYLPINLSNYLFKKLSIMNNKTYIYLTI